MSILAIVKFALSFADSLMKYLSAEQLLDAGAHMAKSEGLQRAIEANRQADTVIADVNSGRLSDPFNPKG